MPESAVDSACEHAARAFSALSTLPPTSRAAILDAIAAALDARRDEILSTCADETALTIDELTPEFARMTGTLRMFADLVREGSWVRAAIDGRYEPSAQAEDESPPPVASQTSSPRAKVSHPPLGPNHDLRSLLIPLGPVAVFGSSNFPLAYGVCGGDTASALAAGCPVIVKEHPAHPRTGRLLAAMARRAIETKVPDALQEERRRGEIEIAERKAKDADFDDWHLRRSLDWRCRELESLAHIVAYVQNEDPADYSVAEQLIQHYEVAAVGFTGSTSGGLALERLSRKRHLPIPVYAEMGSLNTVFVCPAAFARRPDAIADQIAASVLARVGQQCTKPGVVFIAGNNEHWTLHTMICERLLAAPPRRMLARTVADNYYRRLDMMAQSRGILETTPLPTAAQRSAMLGVPVVIAAGDIAMEDEPEVWEEIFGPAIIIARCHGTAPSFMPSALTVSIYADPDDIDGSFHHQDGSEWGEFARWSTRVMRHAGRVIANGPPTGVRVATATVHGGPFPATNRPDTTAVGPRAIERWCRPICFQNCPDTLLPPELQDANPRAIWRTINGQLTRAPLT